MLRKSSAWPGAPPWRDPIIRLLAWRAGCDIVPDNNNVGSLSFNAPIFPLLTYNLDNEVASFPVYSRSVEINRDNIDSNNNLIVEIGLRIQSNSHIIRASSYNTDNTAESWRGDSTDDYSTSIEQTWVLISLTVARARSENIKVYLWPSSIIDLILSYNFMHFPVSTTEVDQPLQDICALTSFSGG